MERLFDDGNEFDAALSEAMNRASVEDIASKMDRQFVLDNVIPELISVEEYDDFKFKVPYLNTHGIENMEGVVAIPTIVFKDEPVCKASTKVTGDMMMSFDISKKELEEAAFTNLEKKPYKLQGMTSMLFSLDPDMARMFGMPEPETDRMSPDELYVVTNESGVKGANTILNTELQTKLAENFGNYYVLPSSKHEVIIVPEQMAEAIGHDTSSLCEMVSTINATVLEPKDKLTDNVFRYDSETECIQTVSADSESGQNIERD